MFDLSGIELLLLGISLLIVSVLLFRGTPEDRAKRKVFWLYEAAGDITDTIEKINALTPLTGIIATSSIHTPPEQENLEKEIIYDNIKSASGLATGGGLMIDTRTGEPAIRVALWRKMNFTFSTED